MQLPFSALSRPVESSRVRLPQPTRVTGSAITSGASLKISRAAGISRTVS